jgi:hypothetical protein
MARPNIIIPEATAADAMSSTMFPVESISMSGPRPGRGGGTPKCPGRGASGDSPSPSTRNPGRALGTLPGTLWPRPWARWMACSRAMVIMSSISRIVCTFAPLPHLGQAAGGV